MDTSNEPVQASTTLEQPSPIYRIVANLIAFAGVAISVVLGAIDLLNINTEGFRLIPREGVTSADIMNAIQVLLEPLGSVVIAVAIAGFLLSMIARIVKE